MFFNFKKIRKIILTIHIYACILSSSFSQIENLHQKTLKNGLEIFVLEDSTVPLVYIEVGVKTGAISQTKQNAGLFHLYEHILFKGNEKFKNQKEFMAQLNRLGTSSHNGSTGVDLVNYFFTIPAKNAKAGIEFWATALRFPLFSENELENEKKVVTSEILGNFSDSARIFNAFFSKKLFPKSPWKLDPAGTVQNVEGATILDLKKIKSEFYSPKNTAFFVGGDVKSEEIFSFCQEFLGDWQNDFENPSEIEIPSKTPLAKTEKWVFPNEKVPVGHIQAFYILRAPDAQIDFQDTYAADVLCEFLENPQNEFSRIFLQNAELQIPDSSHISYSYLTRRASGIQDFFCSSIGLESTILKRAEGCFETLTKKALPILCEKKTYKKYDLQKTKKALKTKKFFSLETPEKFISNLAFFWSCAGSEYFFGYEENLQKVCAEDIANFAKKYFSLSGIFALHINPKSYEALEKDFLDAGYQKITAKNSFWFYDDF